MVKRKLSIGYGGRLVKNKNQNTGHSCRKDVQCLPDDAKNSRIESQAGDSDHHT